MCVCGCCCFVCLLLFCLLHVCVVCGVELCVVFVFICGVVCLFGYVVLVLVDAFRSCYCACFDLVVALDLALCFVSSRLSFNVSVFVCFRLRYGSFRLYDFLVVSGLCVV